MDKIRIVGFRSTANDNHLHEPLPLDPTNALRRAQIKLHALRDEVEKSYRHALAFAALIAEAKAACDKDPSS